jgi:hypothetical protein
MRFSAQTDAQSLSHGFQHVGRSARMAAGRVARAISVRSLLVVAVLAAGVLVGTASPAVAATRTTCVPYQLHTPDYGLLTACTQSIISSDTLVSVSRAGHYSPHNGKHSWPLHYQISGGKDLYCVDTNSVEEWTFYGGRHISTAYGAASWGVEVRFGAFGRFGWYNWHSGTFSATSGPLAFSRNGFSSCQPQ